MIKKIMKELIMVIIGVSIGYFGYGEYERYLDKILEEKQNSSKTKILNIQENKK